MAKLTEHQGKELFRKVGIPVPTGRVVDRQADAAAAADAIGYPVAIKAQILAGKRGLAGGILFAHTRAEAGNAAGNLLGSLIHGHRVERLLVEPKARIERELYVAVMSDPGRRAPVIMVSTEGGMGIEASIAAGQGAGLAIGTVDVLRGAPPYFCLDLLRGLDLPGKLAAELARIMSRLYQLYRTYDCTLAEINPLAVTPKGLIALDARIALDDDALFRHPEFGIERNLEVGDRAPTALEIAAGKIDEHDHRGSAHFVQIDPTGELAAAQNKVPIGFDGVGTGVSMAVMDELVPLGFLPMNFCDTSGNPTASKLYRITKIILAQPGIEGYVFASCLSSQQLDNTARGIVKAFKEVFRGHDGMPTIPCVFSFRGAWDETALALFEEHCLTRSPWIKMLGRDSTERDVALAMAELHGRWRAAQASGKLPVRSS